MLITGLTWIFTGARLGTARPGTKSGVAPGTGALASSVQVADRPMTQQVDNLQQVWKFNIWDFMLINNSYIKHILSALLYMCLFSGFDWCKNWSIGTTTSGSWCKLLLWSIKIKNKRTEGWDKQHGERKWGSQCRECNLSHIWETSWDISSTT